MTPMKGPSSKVTSVTWIRDPGFFSLIIEESGSRPQRSSVLGEEITGIVIHLGVHELPYLL